MSSPIAISASPSHEALTNYIGIPLTVFITVPVFVATNMHATLQENYRVVAAGLTTLAAALNSHRMGFHTLAIEQRSSEVWRILGAVKTEFGKFGDVLDKVKGQLTLAANNLDKTAMSRKLREVNYA